MIHIVCGGTLRLEQKATQEKQSKQYTDTGTVLSIVLTFELMHPLQSKGKIQGKIPLKAKARHLDLQSSLCIYIEIYIYIYILHRDLHV